MIVLVLILNWVRACLLNVGEGDLHIEQLVAIRVDNVVANALAVISQEVDASVIKDLSKLLDGLGSLGTRDLGLDGRFRRLIGEEGLGGSQAHRTGSSRRAEESCTSSNRPQGHGSSKRHCIKV